MQRHLAGGIRLNFANFLHDVCTGRRESKNPGAGSVLRYRGIPRRSYERSQIRRLYIISEGSGRLSVSQPWPSPVMSPPTDIQAACEKLPPIKAISQVQLAY